MYNHLLDFITKQNILHKYQFGFRKQHSTNHAVISLVEKLHNALDQGNIAITWFSVVFSFFEKTTYCRARRPSVEIISFRGNSLSHRPIELKIGLNVREGVVHVRKAWFFEILIASCKFMQFAIFCK